MDLELDPYASVMGLGRDVVGLQACIIRLVLLARAAAATSRHEQDHDGI